MVRKLVPLLALVACLSAVAPAWALVVVPEGNRETEQPAIPGASKKRTADLRTSFEAKYERVLKLLKDDAGLRDKIKSVSKAYGIDPVHVAGAIVGEHTFNVDAYDRLQTYYVKAVSYVNSNFAFENEGEKVTEFVERPQFEDCDEADGSYAVWICREQVWDKTFRGKTVDGQKFPRETFSKTFFQPFYAGQTFGLGQLNPLTALQMSDLVNKVSGLPKLQAKDARKVYETIMDPDLTLPYVAATLKTSIDAYKSIAGFDISKNAGLTATLYNLGDPKGRAEALLAKNGGKKGGRIQPQENYYGWFVNEKIEDLKSLF